MIHEQVQQIEQPIIIETNTENVECQNSVETRIAELTSQLSDLQQRVSFGIIILYVPLNL